MFGSARSIVVAASLLIAAPAQAASLTTLHHFMGTDGNIPNGLAVDAKGELFGTTWRGGAADQGVLFRLQPPAAGETRWKRQVLHVFRGGTDGARPVGVTLAADGTIYGATHVDGPLNGSVYSVRPPRDGGTIWTYRILHGFANQADGILPFSAPIVGRSGRLYGTTEFDVGFGQSGTVYELAPPTLGSTKWSERVICSFGATYVMGMHPMSPPLRTADGSLLVTTYTGGINRLTPPAMTDGKWGQEVLAQAPGYGGVIHYAYSDGRAFGTSSTGYVAGDEGSVFALVPPTSPTGGWTVDVLHVFTGGADGALPRDIVRIGKAIYGVTEAGGSAGLGTLFRLDPPTSRGGGWIKTTVHSFRGTKAGSGPTRLVVGPDAALYGITSGGGAYGKGTVFRFVP
jgi:uncharacterized repeat protein (TIGR03803 family)